MWIAITISWLISLFIVYIITMLKVRKYYFKEFNRIILGYEKFITRWVRVNDQYVNDMAHISLENNASAQQRNVHLLTDNRRLKKKVHRLAYKYGATSKKIRKIKDRSVKQSHIMDIYIDTINRIYKDR